MATYVPPHIGPPGPPLYVTGSDQLPSADVLTADEVAIFDRDIRQLCYLQSLQRDLSDLLMSDYDLFLLAANMAKATLGTNSTFTGVGARGSEIGMQIIRAVTVMNPGIASGGTPVLSWIQTYGSPAPGWMDVFGSSANPVNLSQKGSSGNSATNTYNSVLLAFGSLINSQPVPLLQEYRFHVGQIDYGVHPINWQLTTNMAYAKLFGKIIIPSNRSFWMRGDITTKATDGTQLFGIAFCTGDYMTRET